MVKDKINLSTKYISVSKAILGAMWHLKEAGREKLFSHKYVKLFCNNKHKNTHRSSIFRMCRANLLKRDYNDTFILTEKGRGYALSAFMEVETALHQKSDQEWDGGWRIIFFDIPEEKRRFRDYLRKILKSMGFYELQKSIWVYPYQVPPFLRDFIFQNHIKPHVRFITTNSIDNDRDLRIVFGLIGTKPKQNNSVLK